ncbi:amidase signature enzyme [Phycomyces nitens]|nr:amidase signature enzyme [Phycomyces nitens]
MGPLDGMTIGIKDNFCTLTLPTTCGSAMLKEFVSPFDATVVRLLKDAGGLLIGKTNMDEFGMGSANVYSDSGAVNHPFTCEKSVSEQDRRVPGGSSGGSAAAVAMKMCEIALGSDTGGSVRLPASYCGVVGFKPSYGRCSRNGLVAYANSLDTVGILSGTVEQASMVYDTISKHDPKDPSSMPDQLRSKLDKSDAILSSQWTKGNLNGLVVGIPQEYYVDPMCDDVVDVWRSGIQFLKEQGASIKSISLPHTHLALPAYYIIALAEASSNLARYDGVRFGHRSSVNRPEDTMLYADTRAEGFGAEVQRRILLGTHVLTAGTFDTLFLPAQKARRLIQTDFDKVFYQHNSLYESFTETEEQEKVHVILTPSAISSAPKMANVLEKDESSDVKAVDAYMNDVMTVPASLAGLPAITVPFGESAADGYPIGLQLMAQYGHDRFLISIANTLAKYKA